MMHRRAKTLATLALIAGLGACGGEKRDPPADTATTADPSAAQPATQSATQSAAVPEAPAAASPAPAAPPPPAFAQCLACHSVEPGRNGIGPTLAGIYGAKAGEVPGYAFSPALRQSGITWDRATLDQWLAGPIKLVPGTRMVMPVTDPVRRKEIVDYLETLK